MRIDEGPFRFEWVEDWAEIPEPAAAARGWAHPGMVLSPAGTIVTFHPGLPRALELAADGALRASWDVPVVEGHGIARRQRRRRAVSVVRRPGSKRDPGSQYSSPIEGPPAP